MLPKSVAQLTGIVVCGIVVFGTDLDVTYAMPLGVFAGRAGDVLRRRWPRRRRNRSQAIRRRPAGWC